MRRHPSQREFLVEEAVALLAVRGTSRYSAHLGIGSAMLRSTSTAIRDIRGGALEAREFDLLLAAIRADVDLIGASIVSRMVTLLDNENWSWYGPVVRLCDVRWVVSGSRIQESEIKMIRRLARGFIVPEPQLEVSDALDAAAFRWFSRRPGDALYAAMNEHSVRSFFAKLRAQAPDLTEPVALLASQEAKRVGAPTPQPDLTF